MLAAPLAGCTPGERRAARNVHGAAQVLGGLAAIGLAVGSKIDRPARRETVETDEHGLLAAPDAPSTRYAGLVPPFDVSRAQAALTNVDLINCRGSAPHGYGRATVTLRPSGEVYAVVVDAAMSANAAKCIGEELRRARVPVFSGNAVTMGTTWYLP